jgi:hypothetical protein
VSELKRLMSILKQVFERPEAREEFRIEVFKLHENDPALYEETMVDLEKLEPVLYYETRDFISNILDVREFLKKLQES